MPLALSSTRGWPEQAEVAAYYVVCESLANVGKHARAEPVTVDDVAARRRLVVEVVDDGVGGAEPSAARPARARRPG